MKNDRRDATRRTWKRERQRGDGDGDDDLDVHLRENRTAVGKTVSGRRVARARTGVVSILRGRRLTPAEYRTHERAREDIFQRRDRRAHLLLRVLLAVHGRGDFQSGRARPRRIAARGVRDERGGRPSKRALRDDRARLSAKSSRRRRRAGTARRDDDGRRSRGRRGPGRATRGERACRDGDADARDGGHVIRAGEGEAPAAD